MILLLALEAGPKGAVAARQLLRVAYANGKLLRLRLPILEKPHEGPARRRARVYGRVGRLCRKWCCGTR